MTFTIAAQPRYICELLTQPSLVCQTDEEASVAQLQGQSRNSCLLSVMISLELPPPPLVP